MSSNMLLLLVEHRRSKLGWFRLAVGKELSVSLYIYKLDEPSESEVVSVINVIIPSNAWYSMCLVHSDQ